MEDPHQVPANPVRAAAHRARGAAIHAPPVVNPVLDPSSSYFLHPSESPGAVLSPTILTGKNYHS